VRELCPGPPARREPRAPRARPRPHAGTLTPIPARRTSSRGEEANGEITAASLLRRTSSSSTYVFPHGGLTVKQSVCELTSDIPIYRVQPYIYESEVRRRAPPIPHRHAPDSSRPRPTAPRRR
jgi:hypothetical protein